MCTTTAAAAATAGMALLWARSYTGVDCAEASWSGYRDAQAMAFRGDLLIRLCAYSRSGPPVYAEAFAFGGDRLPLPPTLPDGPSTSPPFRGHRFPGGWWETAQVSGSSFVNVDVPLFGTTGLAALTTAALGRGLIRRRTVDRPPGHCRRCGYDLRASPDRCPECGRAAAAGR